MVRLSPEEVSALPDDDYALPESRRYYVGSLKCAIGALSKVSEQGTQEEKERVARAVHRKYPQLRAKLREIANA